MTVNEIVQRLEGVTKTTAGWTAKCPGHDDRNASLSIAEGEGGRVLLKCHAGCDIAGIARAMGLCVGDFFKQREAAKPRLVKTYDYRNSDGELVYQVCRYDPKDFRQRRPDGKGKWVWNLMDTTRILYLLPAVLKAVAEGRTVFVVEGEKDCDALADLGLVATCNSGGAGKWLPAYSEALRGADVVILPDKDKPGRDHGQMVATALSGVAKSIKIVELPDRDGHKVKDAADWIHAGGTREELETLVAGAPAWEPREASVSKSFQSIVAEITGKPSFNHTDLGNAERLVFRHGKDMRFCHALGTWLIWDGTRWAPDKNEAITRLAKDTVRAIYDDGDTIRVAELDSKDDRDAAVRKREAITRHAKHSESAAALSAMIALAQSESGIPIDHNILDANPWLLNVQNGTLDLRTGQLHPHNRDDLLTKISPVTYNHLAQCPTWEAFLMRVMNGDMAMITYLQRAIGYTLTGQVSEQVLFFNYGTGANGKSTMVNVLSKHLLGQDYAVKSPNTLIQIAKSGDGVPTDKADLLGMRMALCNEVAEGRRMAESDVKDLTGGDTITARRMRQDFFRFQPTHKMWISGNHRPVVLGTDTGIWRRIHLIPFEVEIPPGERDSSLESKLAAEASGILAWAVEGCLQWQKLGLNPPAKVIAAVADYRCEMDSFGRFVDEKCVQSLKSWAATADIVRAYNTWAQSQSEDELGQRAITNRLRDRGFAPKKLSDGSRGWAGLELVAAPDFAEVHNVA